MIFFNSGTFTNIICLNITSHIIYNISFCDSYWLHNSPFYFSSCLLNSFKFSILSFIYVVFWIIFSGLAFRLKIYSSPVSISFVVQPINGVLFVEFCLITFQTNQFFVNVLFIPFGFHSFFNFFNHLKNTYFMAYSILFHLEFLDVLIFLLCIMTDVSLLIYNFFMWFVIVLLGAYLSFA